MHFGRFLHFSKIVVGVTLKLKFSAATSNLCIEQKLVHLSRFLHFSQKVVGVTLKTEAFISNFQFTYRAKFSAFL